MFIFFLQYQIEVSGLVAAILAIASAIAGFIVAYVYFRSGIERKKADGYKGLLEIEEIKAIKYESLYKATLGELNGIKLDYEALSVEYSQLSELFAKKSLILEAFTGQYGGAAKAVEALAAEGRLATPKKLMDNSGGGD